MDVEVAAVVVVAEVAEVDMMEQLPADITFQWHITDQCNFRCSHCYQDSYTEPGASYEDQLLILEKLSAFVLACKKVHGKVRAHINFTGGEPFVRKDFLKLLKATKAKRLFSFAILSNGYLLSDEGLSELKRLGPRFIQISLEGGRKTNDRIRGKGSYTKIISAIRTYRKFKIPVMLSFTANAVNYNEFGKVVKVGRKYGAFKVWTDRYLPSNDSDELCLSTSQVREFFEIIKKEQHKSKYYFFSKTQVSANRALQFLVSGGHPYRCSAGRTLLAILPQGDIMPCRRLPITVGNILKEDLVQLYLNNDILKDIRKPEVDEACTACYYKNSCAGGLKCLSYAKSNNYKLKDPNCWIANKVQESRTV